MPTLDGAETANSEWSHRIKWRVGQSGLMPGLRITWTMQSGGSAEVLAKTPPLESKGSNSVQATPSDAEPKDHVQPDSFKHMETVHLHKMLAFQRSAKKRMFIAAWKVMQEAGPPVSPRVLAGLNLMCLRRRSDIKLPQRLDRCVMLTTRA